MKKILILTIFFISTLLNPFSSRAATTKYFGDRIWNYKTFKWAFKKPLSSRKAKRLKKYFRVYYKNNKIVKIKFPYYRGKGTHAIKGYSIEYYGSNETLEKRENFIGKKKVSFYKFKYGSSGKMVREEHYAQRLITYYKKDGTVRKKKRQTKLLYKFIYHYKGKQLTRRACYDGIHKQPFGIWLYFNSRGYVVKKEKYELDGANKGKKILTMMLKRNKKGEIVAEKHYMGKKPLTAWYYNDIRQNVQKDEFFDGLLIRRYKYFYKQNGKIKKAELYEYKTLIETLYFNAKGKVVKRVRPKK